MEVVSLTAAHAARAAAVLADAMTDDPGWIHVFPGTDTRTARLRGLFDLAVGGHFAGLAASRVVVREGELAAAAIWAPPGAHDLPWSRAAAFAPRAAWLVGRRIPAALRLYREMTRRAPREPHHYLVLLGVDPRHQGRGLGVAVLQPTLDACDATRTLAWLESTNPRNHAFYRRVGFDVADRVAIAGGPSITWFARPPR